MKIALALEYDGREYCGWQKQPDCNTIQSQLETALSRIANSPIRVVVAGRTDTGVHAFCQVVHFETYVVRPLTAWVRGVNTFLPDDISVLWATEVDHDFHARFCAIERTYQYYLLSRSARPGISHGRIGWTHYLLDLERMRVATEYLVGEHDFSAFRSSECQASSPIRKLIKLDIQQIGNFFVFEFCANAFLQHMIRNILGSLIYIGRGKYAPDWINTLLEQRDRTFAAPTFAPDGLYLSAVRYDTKWNLPAVAANAAQLNSMLKILTGF